MALPIVHWHFDPVALSLGPLQIHWYGLCWALAFLAAEFGLRRRLAAIGRGDVDTSALIICALLGTIVGARLGTASSTTRRSIWPTRSGSSRSGKAAWPATAARSA